MELDKELNPYTLFPGFGWVEGLARLVSALTSPPILAIAGVVIATQTVAKSTAWAWAAFILLLSVILPLLYVSWLLRAGKVKSFHLDVREERKRPLLFLLFNIVLVWAVLIIAGASNVFLMIATAGLVLGALMYLVTLYWKISGHCAAAGGLTALTCMLFGQEAMVLSIIIPIVAWSRLRLRSHTLSQTVAGAILGDVIFALTFYMVK
ncbi:MAG TPA: phosphatase PAP2 family protein [Thermodesulfobacteriota bacterium]|nr:phosphatase PAP2 family protein [Thermodesulfobacteriota bacterium]